MRSSAWAVRQAREIVAKIAPVSALVDARQWRCVRLPAAPWRRAAPHGRATIARSHARPGGPERLSHRCHVWRSRPKKRSNAAWARRRICASNACVAACGRRIRRAACDIPPAPWRPASYSCRWRRSHASAGWRGRYGCARPTRPGPSQGRSRRRRDRTEGAYDPPFAHRRNGAPPSTRMMLICVSVASRRAGGRVSASSKKRGRRGPASNTASPFCAGHIFATTTRRRTSPRL
jgi:hypothetical protein